MDLARKAAPLMPRVRYENWRPRGESAALVDTANVIITEFRQQGFSLTLRQLYYQFVARGRIPNSDRSYKNLGSVINRGRMAGLIDWYSIEDRTRSLISHPHWEGPEQIIESSGHSFDQDLWRDQPVRIEIWVEKEALVSVVQRPANAWNCAYFACRGYVSQSEQWRAGRRIHDYITGGQRVIILHLGDHDPSGIDMTRDIRDRITHFICTDEWGYPPETGWKEGTDFVSDDEFVEQVFMEMWEKYLPQYEDDVLPFEVRRIALNMDQIIQYAPPPNPAKLTDSRSGDYITKFGRQSWELDALNPTTIAGLIETEVLAEIDMDKFIAARQHVTDVKASLQRLADTPWGEIDAWLTERE